MNEFYLMGGVFKKSGLAKISFTALKICFLRNLISCSSVYDGKYVFCTTGAFKFCRMGKFGKFKLVYLLYAFFISCYLAVISFCA